MKCPLMLMTWQSAPDEMSFDLKECLKADCAWWAPGSSLCVMRDLAQYLFIISEELDNIKVKMPYVPQL